MKIMTKTYWRCLFFVVFFHFIIDKVNYYFFVTPLKEKKIHFTGKMFCFNVHTRTNI